MHSTLPTITSPARRRRGVYALGGALLAGGLVLAAPLAASAHVSVSPGAADAGTVVCANPQLFEGFAEIVRSRD